MGSELGYLRGRDRVESNSLTTTITKTGYSKKTNMYFQ
jgi:hypothetical protein